MTGALDADSELPCTTVLSIRRLSDDARDRLRPELNVRRYLDALLADGMRADAIDVLSHALPKRYAIAWALECLQSADPATVSPIDRTALAAVQRWLQDPSEANRRAAMDLAERLHYDSAGAWLAAAAGWSSGSLAPADLTAVEPGPALSGEAVAAALKLAAVSRGDFPGTLQQFIAHALATFGVAEARDQAGAAGS